MEISDIAQQVDSVVRTIRADMSRIQNDIGRLQHSIQQQSSQQPGYNHMGQSLERAGYNLSLSITNLGTQIKLAFLWGMCILGTVVGTLIAVLLAILLGKGGT